TTADTTSVAITPRTVVRGRRQTVSEARLPENTTGLEAQPARFTAGMWAVILFVSSEAMFFTALFTAYFYLRTRIPAWEPVFQRCTSADCEKPRAFEDILHGNFAPVPTDFFGLHIPLVLINTIVLLSSSVTMQIAVNAIKHDQVQK